MRSPPSTPVADRSAGQVIWITGLPASGKTTLARELVSMLRKQGKTAVWFDSDELRKVLTPQPTYTQQERDWFYGALDAIAVLCSIGGANVIVSATAPLRRYRDAARAAVSRFTEIYLTCPPEELRRRDPKRLYERAAAGEVTSLPGLGAPYEPPLHPEIVLDGAESSPQIIAARVLSALEL